MAHPLMFTVGIWLVISIVFLALADIAVATREKLGPKRGKLWQMGAAITVTTFSLFVALLIGFSNMRF